MKMAANQNVLLATNQNGLPIKMAANQNGRQSKWPPVKMATNQNGRQSKWPQGPKQNGRQWSTNAPIDPHANLPLCKFAPCKFAPMQTRPM